MFCLIYGRLCTTMENESPLSCLMVDPNDVHVRMLLAADWNTYISEWDVHTGKRKHRNKLQRFSIL